MDSSSAGEAWGCCRANRWRTIATPNSWRSRKVRTRSRMESGGCVMNRDYHARLAAGDSVPPHRIQWTRRGVAPALQQAESVGEYRRTQRHRRRFGEASAASGAEMSFMPSWAPPRSPLPISVAVPATIPCARAYIWKQSGMDIRNRRSVQSNQSPPLLQK